MLLRALLSVGVAGVTGLALGLTRDLLIVREFGATGAADALFVGLFLSEALPQACARC